MKDSSIYLSSKRKNPVVRKRLKIQKEECIATGTGPPD
jgi:hypothetical protein